MKTFSHENDTFVGMPSQRSQRNVKLRFCGQVKTGLQQNANINQGEIFNNNLENRLKKHIMFPLGACLSKSSIESYFPSEHI